MSPPKSDPEQDTMKIVLLVAGAGGIGGFLSWVYAITVGQPPMLHSLLAIPASIALGAGAAFVGIFALAHTDTRVLTRCLAFAVLCGLSWKPIYDAGNALVKQSIRQQETKKELTQLEQLTKTLPNTSGLLRAEKIGEMERIVTDLSFRIDEIDSPEIRNRARVQVRTLTTLLAVDNALQTPQFSLALGSLSRELL